jgi:hypothetical protein
LFHMIAASHLYRPSHLASGTKAAAAAAAAAEREAFFAAAAAAKAAAQAEADDVSKLTLSALQVGVVQPWLLFQSVGHSDGLL